MNRDRINVPYNRDLKRLEEVLAGVCRSGNYFVRGALDIPMPCIEVKGVGILSFPVPESQVREVVRRAVRAPYGRGEETLIDESVRKVWQLPPDDVRIGGRTWASSFQSILSTVQAGLGCADVTVTAEFYKLLVYDEGGFFKAHRDTEKAAGMFGTLVVVLPSPHRGGDLVVRHAGREVAMELASEEVSEVTFAAFYADCEHEVRPVTSGNRICLIYNLLQKAASSRKASPLAAPLYDAETAATAEILRKTFRDGGAPTKLVWLLEHHYSPEGLSFAGLKGADAARVRVLSRAAVAAGCALHLGLVHIEENGPAEPDYSDHEYQGRRRHYDCDDDEVEENADSDAFDVVEVSDGSRHIDRWVDEQDRPADYGPLPLEDGEVVPAGALDGEDPDEQRLMEATGNEGASFERAYHRAAVVIWPLERSVNVLLQAGVEAALPHLRDRVSALTNAGAESEASRAAVLAIARQIVKAWEERPPTSWFGVNAKESIRGEMIELLSRLEDRLLLERFVRDIVTRQYDGSENRALAAITPLLGPKRTSEIFARLVEANMIRLPGDCVDLLSQCVHGFGDCISDDWKVTLCDVGTAIVTGLPAVSLTRTASEGGMPVHYPYTSALMPRGFDAELLADDDDEGRFERKQKPIETALIVGLLDALDRLGAVKLRKEAASAFIGNSGAFDVPSVIVPALKSLHTAHVRGFAADGELVQLWVHSAEFLLARSEQPPTPPSDWRQTVKLVCSCEDCRALQTFALDPLLREARFRIRKERRRHLHDQIGRHQLDMTHVTDRRGSPQTLVCTKTRGAYGRQCERHRADGAAMEVLLDVGSSRPGINAALVKRLTAAARQRPSKVKG